METGTVAELRFSDKTRDSRRKNVRSYKVALLLYIHLTIAKRLINRMVSLGERTSYFVENRVLIQCDYSPIYSVRFRASFTRTCNLVCEILRSYSSHLQGASLRQFFSGH